MSRERIIWIDAVKSFAVTMVLLSHILWIMNSLTSEMVGVGNGFLTFNRILASTGVPLFMMVSGVLLLDKKFETISDIKSFYIRGWLPLFITAEIWIVVYSVVNIGTLSFKELLLNMSFVHKPEVHLWYVRLIVAYYIMLPLLIGVLKKNKIITTVFLLVVFTITFAYNGWLIYCGSDCPTSSNRSYFCYVIYMLIGYGLSKIRVTRFKVVFAVIVMFMGGVILYATLTFKEYYLWYDNPLLAISVSGLFFMIRAIFAKMGNNRFIMEISKMSYGLYLSHMVIVYGIGYYMCKNGCNYCVFYLSWLVVGIVDAVILCILKRFSCYLSKILFRY